MLVFLACVAPLTHFTAEKAGLIFQIDFLKRNLNNIAVRCMRMYYIANSSQSTVEVLVSVL